MSVTSFLKSIAPSLGAHGIVFSDWESLDDDSRERLVDSLVGPGQYQKIKTQAEAADYFKSEVAIWGKMTRAIGYSAD